MKRSSMLGALVLCALLLGGLGAVNASAAELTAVTCEEVEPGKGNYETSACETPKVAGSNFVTKALPVGQTTEVTGSGVGKAILKGVVAFLNVEITCEETEITGHVTNREPSAGKHTIEGSKIFNDYKKCHASLQSDTTKTCRVEDIATAKKDTILTKELKSSTTTEHNVKFEPAAVGGSLADFNVLNESTPGESGCPIPKTKVTVAGSVLGVADTSKHHHVTFTPATNGGSLKVNGGAASYEGTSNTVVKGTANSVGAETFTTPPVSGLTAVTCEEVAKGTGSYDNSICETPKAAGGNFQTKAIPVGQTTEVTGEGIGNVVLKGTVASLNAEVTCEETKVTGHVTNYEPGFGEHQISGTRIFVTYKRCHASLQSDTTKKCEVESITGVPKIKGTIGTKELKATTTTEHNVKFEPVTTGGPFTEFKILAGECTIPETTVKVTGSLVGVVDTGIHNHVTFTPATNGALFKVNGGTASYEGTSNASMTGTNNVVGAETFT